MYHPRTPVHKRFRGGSGGGGYRGGSSRFSARRSKPKKEKLDISAFINKTVVPRGPQKVYVADNAFADFGLNSALLRGIDEKGYVHPTAIQDKIIPSILQGKDVVGLSNTGTGKTAAFLIPIVEKILKRQSDQVLIVAPTRELALQIDKELRGLTRGMRIFSVTLIGGENIRIQIRRLRARNNFIIGTPGRLIDLLKRGDLTLNGVHTVILDEADRMLDMGFINDIRLLMDYVPQDRQTLCFSATMSPSINKLINDFLKEPSTISVKTAETPENIHQDVIQVRNLNKIDVLHDLLKNKDFRKVLVFGRTKRGVEKLSYTLQRRGIKAESIHSDKSLGQRKMALLSFKRGSVQILVATDVAARGLDIDNVTHVINYDIPETYDDYIHRIGRTGRGTQRGKALTFIE